MRVVKKSWIIGLLLWFAACQPAAPLRQFTKGQAIASYDFVEPASFEEGAYGAATLNITSGVYEIDVLQGDNVLWWGQWGATLGDTVIDVDTEQMAEPNENAYGVMCRVRGTVGQKQPVDPALAAIMSDSTPEPTSEATAAATAAATAEATAAATSEATAEPTNELAPLLTSTPEPTRVDTSNGDGYLFLLQGGGSFAIMRARGRNLTPLVNWTQSDAIKQGPSRNHIQAICAGSYLAMYVNDQFLGDATDDSYTEGQVGLAASSANRLGTRIDFDNLTISEVAHK
jgi:hypothetical protein